jgi:hypothetical protein
MITLIIIIALSILLAASIGVILFLIRKLLDVANKIEIYENWITSIRSDLDETYKELKRIDEAHIFEKDDVVGFVFSDIVNTIKKVNEEYVKD